MFTFSKALLYKSHALMAAITHTNKIENRKLIKSGVVNLISKQELK